MSDAIKALKACCPVEKPQNGLRHCDSATLEDTPFPFKAFEGTIIGDAALHLEEAYQAPRSASCMVGLGMLGTLLGRMVKVSGAFPKPSYVNEFILIGADSAQYKSNIHDFFKEPVDEWQSEQMEKFREGSNVRKLRIEKLRKELKDKVNDAENEVKKTINHDDYIYASDTLKDTEDELNALESEQPPMVYVQDATPEAIEVYAQANGGCLGIFNDEGARILSIMQGKYTASKQVDLSLYNSMWSSSSQSTVRVDKDRTPVYCPEVTGSMVILSQPTIVDKLIQSPETRFQGLLGRFLVHRTPTVLLLDEGVSIEPPTKLKSRWRTLSRAILDDRYSDDPPQIEVRVSEAASERLREFNNKMITEAQRNYTSQPFAKRAREHAIRIAGSLAYLKGVKEVDTEIADQACEIVSWHWESTKEIMFIEERNEYEEQVDRLLDLLDGNEGVLGKRDTLRSMHVTEERLIDLLNDPDLADYCIWKKGGRNWLGHKDLKPDADT